MFWTIFTASLMVIWTISIVYVIYCLSNDNDE